VFLVLDLTHGKERAMKIEELPADKLVMKMEVAVLRELNGPISPCCPATKI
jgi:hypothetical protein